DLILRALRSWTAFISSNIPSRCENFVGAPGGAPTLESSLGRRNRIDRMSSTTVLVIRPGALGDTILTLPFLDTIQAENPDAKITFLGNRSYRDLIPPCIQ